MSVEGNGFSNKEILITLDRKVDEGFRELKALMSMGHQDHEARIRSLEATGNRWSGIVSFIVAAAGLATAVFAVVYS